MLAECGVVLLTLPMQALRGFLGGEGRVLLAADLVACCKGIDLETLQGPADVVRAAGARGGVALLTGPSFAADIARGLPTALTLACADGRGRRCKSGSRPAPCGFIGRRTWRGRSWAGR